MNALTDTLNILDDVDDLDMVFSYRANKLRLFYSWLTKAKRGSFTPSPRRVMRLFRIEIPTIYAGISIGNPHYFFMEFAGNSADFWWDFYQEFRKDSAGISRGFCGDFGKFSDNFREYFAGIPGGILL